MAGTTTLQKEARRDSEERFRSLCAAAPIGLFQTDADGRCVYTNERWHAISGLTAEESLGYGPKNK